VAPRVQAWERRLVDALAAAGGVTGDVEVPMIVPPAQAPDPALVAQDLVPPPAVFDPRTALGDLDAPITAHCRALAAGDVAALCADLAPEAGPEAAAEYAALGGPFERIDVVGCARLGRQRVVKLCLESVRGRVVLQERWMPSPAGWRIAAVEATRAGTP
jgi:hypothetical protein